MHCTENTSFLDSPPHGVKLQQWLRRRFPPTAEHRKLDSCSAPVGGVARQAHQGGGLGWHGAAYFEGASMSQHPAPLVRPKGCCGALDPPEGGTFHFEILIMPPLPKTCPKMVPSHKGGSLCVKDAFAKKFFGAGRDSAGGALASVLRKHSTEHARRLAACRSRLSPSRTPIKVATPSRTAMSRMSIAAQI